MIIKAYKYRIYPTKEQSILLDRHIGACRFIYNLALETKQIAYAGHKVNLSCFELCNQLPELKKELHWLKDINAQSLQQAINNLDTAYTNFFKGHAKFPKYKSKKTSNQSFIVPQSFRIQDGFLFLPKFKKQGIKIVLHREYSGKEKRVTISKTKTGKYFASILVETNSVKVKPKKITEQNTVGIDLGIKDFVITSDGEVFENPKYLKNSLNKLKYLQRKYSKYKGKRTLHKLRKLYEQITNQRKDYLHKVSSELVRENQTIAMETLNVSGMMKNHKLAQSISDVSWSMFTSMLEYKAEWNGVNIIKIGRFEPSSKTCSCCGNINKELTLKDREWTCSKCNTQHDRDVNAANNIKTFALRNYVSGTDTKNQNELPTLVGVLTSETINV